MLPNGKNIIDISFFDFIIDKLLSKAVCPTPKICPGTTLCRDEVYGEHPAGLSVRQPTLHPWSQCTTVDLDELHLDVPSAGQDRHQGERRDIDHEDEWQFRPMASVVTYVG